MAFFMANEPLLEPDLGWIRMRRKDLESAFLWVHGTIRGEGEREKTSNSPRNPKGIKELTCFQIVLEHTPHWEASGLILSTAPREPLWDLVGNGREPRDHRLPQVGRAESTH
jgi:hypothetical protein